MPEFGRIRRAPQFSPSGCAARGLNRRRRRLCAWKADETAYPLGKNTALLRCPNSIKGDYYTWEGFIMNPWRAGREYARSPCAVCFLYTPWRRFWRKRGARFDAESSARKEVSGSRNWRHIFRRYSPPTSNSASVIWPSEQYFTASSSTSNVLAPSRAAAFRSWMAAADLSA